MGKSVLVFVSHASEDKESYIDPIVRDLEDCFINVWIDRKRLIPGENLKKSILREGLDKADVALIFFTQNSLKSSWVDREIKHVLRDEQSKGNDFDLNKIIAIFDCKETYEKIRDKYEELTDDLLHLMPPDYSKVQLGQLISAIWSKYLSLQGGDTETQKQLLAKDKEIFQKDKEILELNEKFAKSHEGGLLYMGLENEFKHIFESRKINQLITSWREVFKYGTEADINTVPNYQEALACELVEEISGFSGKSLKLTEKGRNFFKWVLINKETIA